ncbi:glycosyltransferase family 4 protein [Arundinibacter roseus]|uniref:glycosyltransferase family 4 protein n=1 Tax=Arundinibacter roseus TaxID=2070510 RepID=UPI001404938E|nr:glycosyltransferase family 4 protein [Arundinibacter roseus]
MANAISRSSNPVVFGANATLLFDLIPFLPDHVKIIDLTHSFVPEAMNPVEVRSLPYLNRLTKRIVIHENVKLDYQKLYQQAGITDQKWLDHIEVVHNKVGFPRWNIQHKVYAVPPLKVLFVGRNSPEKRIGLIGKIAHILRNDAIQFTLVGGRVADSVAEKHRPYIDFAGEITAPAQLTELYKSHHVILLTSRREGLPLVLMEGMAHGAVPVTTRVGGIGYHVLHLRNGCLIENHEDEEQIVQEMVVCLRQLSEQPEFLKTLGKAAQDSIFQEFSDEQFTQKWQNLLLHP